MRYALFIGILLALLWLAGCSTAMTTDRLKMGYGPAVTETRQGASTYEVWGVQQLVIDPNGAVHIIAAPKGGAPCAQCKP